MKKYVLYHMVITAMEKNIKPGKEAGCGGSKGDLV